MPLLDEAYAEISEVVDCLSAQEDRIKAIIEKLSAATGPKLVANASRELSRQLAIMNRRIAEDVSAVRQLLQ